MQREEKEEEAYRHVLYVELKRSGTLLCPLLGLPIEQVGAYSLGLACVVSSEMEDEQLFSFRSRRETESKAKKGETPGFPSKIRPPSTTNTIPIPEPLE